MAGRRAVHPKKAARKGAAAAAIELRRERALELRLSGHSIRAIAKELGVCPQTAQNDVHAVLDRTIDRTNASAARYRELALQRLDAAVKAIWPKVEAGDCEAIRALARLETHRSKLEGTEVPIKAELSGPDGAPIPVEAKLSLGTKLDALRSRIVAGRTDSEPSEG